MAETLTKEKLEEIEQYIKSFLTEYHNFDLGLREYETRKNVTNEDVPNWISSYNFYAFQILLRQ